MRPLSRLGISPQRAFDCSVVAFAVGCGWIGYEKIQNEDSAAKRVRLQQEQVRKQRLRAEEAKRRLEQVKYMSRLYEEKIELLSQKRQEVLPVLEKTQSMSSRLRNHHKQLEMEVEDLRRRVKVEEELQARSIARDDFETKSNDSEGR